MRYFQFIYILLVFFSACKDEKITADYIIRNVNIVDVENDTIKSSKNIAIEGHKIKSISDDEIRILGDIEIIEGKGKFVIPGLWDMHAHYHSNYHYSKNLLLANGVTGIREMWGKMDTINSIREQSRLGLILSPDIYSSGNIINGVESWLPFKYVSSEQEAINEVKKQFDEGVDFIKIYNGLSKSQFKAISNICEELEIPFSGHIPDKVNYWEAIEQHQQSIEHQMGFLKNCTSRPEDYEIIRMNGDAIAENNFLVEHFDKNKFDSLTTALSNSNTWLCPTNIYWKNFYNRDNPKDINNQLLEYMPRNIQLFWGTPIEILEQKKDEFNAGRNNIKFQISLMGDLVNSGVKILAGTDYPNPYSYPGFSLHDELQLMVEGGMTPIQALRTSTLNPSLFMKKANEYGKIEKDYIASIVLLEENPLEDISNTKKIFGVFLRGKYLSRSRLDDMLIEAKNYSIASFNEGAKTIIN